MLEIRHLEMVDAIARSGSVTKAARLLHLTQPAVSHALSDLEGRLGLTLFQRRPRGMRITPQGERLRAAARLVLHEVQEAEHDLQLVKEGRQGTLRIATQCYTCYHWLPPILAHFAEQFPDVDVQIVPEATADPLQALVEERLDVAIVEGDVDRPDLLSEPLFIDELLAAVPPDHPFAGRALLTPEDFADQVLVLQVDRPRSTLLKEFLGPAGVEPSRLLVLHLTEAVLQTVRAGFGVTAMSEWALRPHLESGVLVGVKLGESGLLRSWSLATRRDRARRATVQALAALLKDGSEARWAQGFAVAGCGPL